jgi:hypothetical protein
LAKEAFARRQPTVQVQRKYYLRILPVLSAYLISSVANKTYWLVE